MNFLTDTQAKEVRDIVLGYLTKLQNEQQIRFNYSHPKDLLDILSEHIKHTVDELTKIDNIAQADYYELTFFAEAILQKTTIYSDTETLEQK